MVDSYVFSSGFVSRFDLKQLKQLCELTQEGANEGHEEDTMSWENADSQKDQALLDLLRSMWNEEDEDDEAADADERRDKENAAEDDDELAEGDGMEVCEEKVNEKELEEIYEFAATQRKKNEEADSTLEKENGETEFTELAEPKRSPCQQLKTTNPNPVLGSDPSLDRSYSSLFSESLGDCEERGLLSCSAQIPQSPEAKVCHKLSSKQSVTGRTLLQSSASIVDDVSLGSSSVKPVLPVPGESPDQQRNRDAGEGFLLKHQSQEPPRLSMNLSPEKKEPELIVLSDSNSPSPDSPLTPLNPEDYTQIRPHPRQEDVVHGDLHTAGVERSPDCPAAVAGQSPLDCSPELSWLIPSTPLQPSKNTSSSSTQTRSSICRMQLFPKSDPSAPVFSPPDLTGDVEVNPERTLPHSSTPLPSEAREPGVHLSSPPNNCSFDKQRLKSKGTKKKLSERMEPGSCHVSPLSDSPSSRLHKGFQNSQRDGERPRSAEWRKAVSLERDKTPHGTMDEKDESEDKDASDIKPHEDAAPSGFLQSFMDLDEPPIAFNDSWGLNTCTDANAGCFSLRLEDSGACSPQERSHTHQHAAPSASERQLTPPGRGVGSPPEARCSRPSTIRAQTDSSPQGSVGRPPPQLSTSLLDSKVWNSWEEEDDDFLPLSQRANPSARLKTPGRYSLLITTMISTV